MLRRLRVAEILRDEQRAARKRQCLAAASCLHAEGRERRHPEVRRRSGRDFVRPLKRRRSKEKREKSGSGEKSPSTRVRFVRFRVDCQTASPARWLTREQEKTRRFFGAQRQSRRFLGTRRGATGRANRLKARSKAIIKSFSQTTSQG
ncbi:hypothetical protein TGRH88_041380 [Toxoplasma gondii]|uniref:Uncharacterized protein n=1 Tax=Toxoplasma gondii TaxID=5811 RepID=A0A7J6JYG5_TOXGO|nr:hypothetical protein TGRH88_041380 [Toxoplasma gondii]